MRANEFYLFCIKKVHLKVHGCRKRRGKAVIGNYVFNYSFPMTLIDFEINRKMGAKG